MKQRQSERGISLIEFIICFLVASIFFGLIVLHMENTLTHTKESALRQEMANLRRLVQVYFIFNDDYPADIRDLFGHETRLYGKNRAVFNAEFLKSLAQDDEGYPLDPFGKRYKYNASIGELSCVTPGYEAW